MITGFLLFTSVAVANCLEILEETVKYSCIDEPALIEHADGQTQIYSCEVEPGVYDIVAFFSFEPDVNEYFADKAELCSGGTLYISDSQIWLDLLSH